MQLKHKIMIAAAALCVIAAGAFFIGNKVDGGMFSVKTGYLAGGTIPADAKIYPIVNEDLRMTVDDIDGTLTAEDIWTLTHYVDLWSTWDDTRNDGLDVEGVSQFVSSERLAQMQGNDDVAKSDYNVDGTQILLMSVEEDGRVYVEYLMQVTGCHEGEGLPEDTYSCINGLHFKKINGNWYEDGVYYGLFERTACLEWYQDAITGDMTVRYTESED